MIQNINNTPQDSGLGDTLFVATTKINENFQELYDLIGQISGMTGTSITMTSELTNDGEDGTNPFITQADVPTSWSISAITGLQSSLTILSGQISTLNTQVSGNTLSISGVSASVNSLTISVSNLSSLITSQNTAISNINNVIDDILQQLDAIGSLTTDAPFDGETYGRNSGAWVVISGSTGSGGTSDLQSVLTAGNTSDQGFTLSNFGTTAQIDLDQGYLNMANGQVQVFYQYNGLALFNSENQNRLEIINSGSNPAYMRFTDTTGGINQGLFLQFQTPSVSENRTLLFPFEEGTIATREWTLNNGTPDLNTVLTNGDTAEGTINLSNGDVNVSIGTDINITDITNGNLSTIGPTTIGFVYGDGNLSVFQPNGFVVYADSGTTGYLLAFPEATESVNPTTETIVIATNKDLPTYGTATIEPDNLTSVFTFPHGLGASPSFVLGSRNQDSLLNPFTTNADATNIIIEFPQSAPVSGGDIIITWMAKL